MKRGEKWVDDVISGKVLACKFIIQACQRHRRDLLNSKSGKLPFVFDSERAQRAIDTIGMFRHTRGVMAGVHFDLQGIQIFMIMSIFGWYRRDKPGRRFQMLYYEVARKGAKTELLAAILTYTLLFTSELGKEIYIAATKLDQAKTCFTSCKLIIKQLMKDSIKIKKMVKIIHNRIYIEETESVLECLPGDSSKLDSLNCSTACIDEYHAHKTSSMLEVIASSQGARVSPLLAVTTTAGFNIFSPCYELRTVVTQVLNGDKKDETLLGVICTLDIGDDWEDENLWVKSNPLIGKTPYWEFMRSQFVKAKNEGFHKEIAFKVKNLNLWQTTSTSFVSDEEYMSCYVDFNEDSLKGAVCYGGLDLAQVEDLCAFVLFFPPTVFRAKARVLRYVWLPEDTAITRSQNASIDYLKWSHENKLTLTKGKTTDYETIKTDIYNLNRKFKIASISYDPYNAHQLIMQMGNDGFIMKVMPQTRKYMNVPTKELYRYYKEQKLEHNDDYGPARWCFSNVVIETDDNDNVKINKKKSIEKVDVVVAEVMAFGEYLDCEGNRTTISFGVKYI